MRLYPPAYIIGRRATRDVTIGGHRVRRGQILFVNIAGIHRRADPWEDPERFDPDRFTPEREKVLPRHAYMPFGAGSRICIGNHFALMEGHILLATILQRVRLELASRKPVGTEALITLRPKDGVWMRASRR
jgi:cytochrome P450